MGDSFAKRWHSMKQDSLEKQECGHPTRLNGLDHVYYNVHASKTSQNSPHVAFSPYLVYFHVKVTHFLKQFAFYPFR